MISVSDYFKQFRDSKEITDDIRKNASVLVSKVSMLLSMIPYETTITSGFRPHNYNKSIGGSANSAHCWGQACDIADPDKIIGNWCINNLEYLKQEKLFMESLTVTHRAQDKEKRWVHLTTRPPKSKNTVFIP